MGWETVGAVINWLNSSHNLTNWESRSHLKNARALQKFLERWLRLNPRGTLEEFQEAAMKKIEDLVKAEAAP